MIGSRAVSVARAARLKYTIVNSASARKTLAATASSAPTSSGEATSPRGAGFGRTGATGVAGSPPSITWEAAAALKRRSVSAASPITPSSAMAPSRCPSKRVKWARVMPRPMWAWGSDSPR
ncbi:hypothetical protein D3C87_1810810 [compost metagenome]